LIEKKSTLQEETRLEILSAFLDKTIRYLREYVQEIKAELVLISMKSVYWNGKIGRTRKYRVFHQSVASASLSAGVGI
jgi:hypothetical protein